ncbi:type I restriction enzyme S subunit [Paraburkholderia sp. RAU2J]|uniref:restriction endonuclease subunit S n=1 Tax=Paraburkholderia sp. RAU2J TaxID=1938810 RepID=UPI000F1F7B89|nr:restriction endonuclease subunit S [Paraburkholderia sp. RAU2J]RKT25629.1 type I restriction enzyme S subunit [Paraburkholderia sp. RAU2J]
MRPTEGFQLLATAPEGMTRLRKLIFSLAVMGKLVPQEQTDEPARVLLQEIRTEKNRRIATGTIKAEKPSTEIDDKEKPYSLPANWEWVRFGNVSINRDGERVPVSSADREKRAKLYDYYGASGVIDKIDGYLFDKTLLLIGEDGANLINRSTPIAFLATGKYWVNNHAHVVDATHDVVMQYLCLFINAISLEPYVTGTAQPKMNQAKLNDIVVALPPIKEQSRIVAKVDELMRLCDELENRGRLEAEQHARLTATLFDALAASESPHALAENWSRIAAHFDLLLDRPEAVDALERTILELAVRGLLLPVDERDGTTSRVDETATANAVEQADEATHDSLNVAPYEIPSSWSWIRFGEIMRDLRYGTSAKCDYKVDGIPVLRIPNLKNGRISTEDLKFGALTTQETARLALVPGDLLLIRSNGSATLVGSAALVREESRDFAFAGYLMRIRLREDVALSTYIMLALETEGVRAQIEGPIRSTSGVKNINSTEVSGLQFPLPPLETQCRIVDRVDDLRRLCADLRERLVARQACQTRFAEALVEQAASTAPLAAGRDDLAAAA